MKIYVIRHGQTKLNEQRLINGFLEDSLTPNGIEQAKAAALTLPPTIKHIYSSSLGRAKETALILNKHLGVELTFHDELKEVNFGDLNGTPYLDEIKQRHLAMDYDWRPSGECFEDVKKRMLVILKKIAVESKDSEALIVGHGGTVRMLNFLESGGIMGRIANTEIHAFDLDKILK